MRSRLAATGVLLQIAFRNLFASRVKTLIVGGIVLFGAALVVVGSSLLDSVNAGMRRSIQGSLGGHIQVFNETSREDLALYGGMMGDSDLNPIEDFAPVKRVLLGVDNVESVVPMGIHDAMVGISGRLDAALEELRDDVRRRLAGDESPALLERLESDKAHVRHMIVLHQEQAETAGALVDEASVDARDRADLARAASDELWAEFDRDPLGTLEFLENRIAPQAVEGNMIFIRYAGTDLEAFAAAFDRMHIVEGTAVPEGQRGILLARLYAEEMLKLRPARRLDQIKEALEHGRRIAGDEELERWARDILTQTRDIVMQLDPVQTKVAVGRLRRALGSHETTLPGLLAELLTVDDGNFASRYDVFYRELAPLLDLYSVGVGDVLTLKAFTQSGYMTAVNVKVYGVFEFAGIERSAFAGYTCLMDLMSFRDLYGYLTAERAKEIAALKFEAGARDVAREDAEAELFGGGEGLVGSTEAEAFDETSLLAAPAADARAPSLFDRVYTQDDIDTGVVLNAAVILDDPGRIDETIAAIEEATTRAGLPIEAVDWQAAAGLVGQFVTVARAVLYTAIGIMFAVALVIINNALVMATLQRVQEIGTIRAIGAQRRFVLLMVLIESTAVGLAFGALGALLGVGIIGLIRALGGIPAGNEQLYFFFSGPALVPALGATSLVLALVIVLVVSVVSGLYPAWIATRITPLQAMQTED